MVIEGYGVRLVRVTADDLEMLRCWRNDPKVSRHMNFRGYISPQMQEEWFRSIDNENNFYFVIEFEGKKVGLINVKDIDYEKKTGEAGLFIYDDECRNTDVPVRASLCQSDFIWDTLGLESLRIHVLKENTVAAKYDRFLGFRLLPGEEDKENQEYVLTREERDRRNSRIAGIRRMLSSNGKIEGQKDNL